MERLIMNPGGFQREEQTNYQPDLIFLKGNKALVLNVSVVGDYPGRQATVEEQKKDKYGGPNVIKEFVRNLARGSQGTENELEIEFYGLVLNFKGIWGKLSASELTGMVGLTQRDLAFMAWIAVERSSNIAVHWFKNA